MKELRIIDTESLEIEYTKNLSEYWYWMITSKTNRIGKICCYIILFLIMSTLLGLSIILVPINETKVLEKEKAELENQIKVEQQKFNFIHLIGTYTTCQTSEPLTDTSIREFIVKTGAWYPDIIYAQYIIESANGTSNLFKNTNNLFGMRTVLKRQTTQIPNQDYNTYGVYNNWQCSVLDRILWDLYTFKEKKPTKEQYLKALSVYAEDNLYINKIKNCSLSF